MMRWCLGMLTATAALAISCERTEPPTGTEGPKQPATGATATAPATQSLREQMEEEVARTADSAKELAASVVAQIRARYEDRVQRELARVDEHIAQLQQQLANASEAARPVIEEQLAQWRQRAVTMRDKMAHLRAASDEVWHELKKDLDATVDQVRQALPGTTQPATVPATQPAQ